MSQEQEEQIITVLKEVYSIWTGVMEAMITAFIIGGIQGGVGAYAQAKQENFNNQQNNQIQ